MKEQFIFKVMSDEEGRYKCLKEDSTQKVPMQSKSVCSDKNEVVSVNSKTPILKFYEDDNPKSTHIRKHFLVVIVLRLM